MSVGDDHHPSWLAHDDWLLGRMRDIVSRGVGADVDGPSSTSGARGAADTVLRARIGELLASVCATSRGSSSFRLDDRQRELLDRRVAWRTGRSDPRVREHQISAGGLLTLVEIAALSRPVAEHPWPVHEASLLHATDQLIDLHVIDEATWSRLAEHYDDPQLLAILLVIGANRFLSLAVTGSGGPDS